MESSRRRVRLVLLAGVVAALGALAAVALADSSPLVTARPTLAGVAALDASHVIACWNQPLETTANITDANFFLQGYSEGRITGTAGGGAALSGTPQPDPSNPNCATLTFTGLSDIRTFSQAVSLSGAVTSTSGQLSLDSKVPLFGSQIPFTSALTERPQLFAASAVASSSTAATAVYGFDQALTNAIDATKFGFYTNTVGDAAFHPGTAATVSADGTKVTVQFSAADQALLATGKASRFVVQAGAVQNQANKTNPVGVTGGATQRPDLGAGGGRTGTDTWAFTFSQPVKVLNAAGLHVFDAGGVQFSVVAGTTPSVSADGRTVTAEFAPDTDGGDLAEVTLETVDAGAVESLAGSVPNSEGDLGVVPLADHAGLTTGPDLTGFTINKSAGTVTFIFDAAIGSVPTPTGFEVVNLAGQVTPAPTQSSGGLLGGPPPAVAFSVSGNTVTVVFSTTSGGLGGIGATTSTANTDSAVGVIVKPGTVKDTTAAATPNPVGAFGVTPATPPPGPTTTTTPTTTTVPTTTTTPAPTPKPAGCASHRVVTLHLRVSVSSRLRSATVTVNGHRVHVSRNLVVRIDLSPYTSTVTVKITGKLRNKHKVHATRRYHPCTAG